MNLMKIHLGQFMSFLLVMCPTAWKVYCSNPKASHEYLGIFFDGQHSKIKHAWRLVTRVLICSVGDCDHVSVFGNVFTSGQIFIAFTVPFRHINFSNGNNLEKWSPKLDQSSRIKVKPRRTNHCDKCGNPVAHELIIWKETWYRFLN